REGNGPNDQLIPVDDGRHLQSRGRGDGCTEELPESQNYNDATGKTTIDSARPTANAIWLVRPARLGDAALTGVGLPRGDIPLALFAFNFGVETGQLTFIAAVLALLAVAGRFNL